MVGINYLLILKYFFKQIKKNLLCWGLFLSFNKMILMQYNSLFHNIFKFYFYKKSSLTQQIQSCGVHIRAVQNRFDNDKLKLKKVINLSAT